MPGPDTSVNKSEYSGFYEGIKNSARKHGFIRLVLVLPVLFVYGVSYSVLSPPAKTPYQADYEELAGHIAVEKQKISTPVSLPAELFYYGRMWQQMAGENPIVNTLVTEGLESLYKCLNYLKDMQEQDEAELKRIIQSKIAMTGGPGPDSRTVDEIYESITVKGEYFSRLFEQLFTQHGLKRLGDKYSDTDVEAFFNLLCLNPEGKKFRRILGALMLNAPYYLIIKNSVNEYYQNNDVLIPVDLFSFTLFMMYLERAGGMDKKPSMRECRNWVFSVIVPDAEKRRELESRRFAVQEIIREEMIMPNPGYFSKAYHPRRHRAIDIASERGTMIRSPVTGTVTYYEKGRKRYITGNYIIIKAERSHFNIFICHMDNKDYIEGHSTEGELAGPIANLTPDWVHPLKKGQFFQVVGNTGRSTGAHTHIQIARRTRPYATYDFFGVNKPYVNQFTAHLKKGGYWNVYSRVEQILLSVLGVAVSRYDSSRHFSDRDPETLEIYRQLQKSYAPVSSTIDRADLYLEPLPEKILRTWFSRDIQEKIIDDRYRDLLRYYSVMALQFNYHMKMQVPLPSSLPVNPVPLTPWMRFYKRKEDGDEAGTEELNHETLFYHALNRYFLYRILQLHNAPRNLRDHLLADPAYTGSFTDPVEREFPEDNHPCAEERLAGLGKCAAGYTDSAVDLSFFYEDDFCESLFNDIKAACSREGVPLDSTFGFFTYHISQMQDSCRTSRFVRFPENREFSYDRKYDEAIRLFFLDIFELAAANGNCRLFCEIYLSPVELDVSLIRRVCRRITRSCTRARDYLYFMFLHRPYPEAGILYPGHLHSVFQQIISNIVKPASWESRAYSGATCYRASESSLFYSLVYEVYLSARERYIKLFPADQLSGVLEAIGLFDSMFKVFCDNALQMHLIDNEHARITRELEVMEKELSAMRNSKRELQEDFRNRSANLETAGDYTRRHSELFSTYISEEEKISRTIASLEQSLGRYRDECGILKNEKEQLQLSYEQKLEKINRDIEDLKSRNTLEQQRFRSEIKKITYDKGKSDLEIIDLKAKIVHLENRLEKFKSGYNSSMQRSGESEVELQNLLKKHEKSRSELAVVRKRLDDLEGLMRKGLGPYAENLTPDELTGELVNVLRSVEVYRNAAVTVKTLQEQQKSDRRSLALNADLVTRLRDRVEKLEVQLQYLRDTKSSERERELEAENKRLEDIVKKTQGQK